MKPLAGKVAVVAGATRGAGRAIAIALGEAGATVYATGRSVRGAPSDLARPETIEETAELITARGGQGIPVRVDHTEPEQVKALFERIGGEQGGRLDIIVNDVWGGEKLTEWGTLYWEGSLDKALLMQRRAVHSHMITSYYGAPLLVQRGEGLIVEVTDGYDYRYRGNLPYSLAKVSVIHLAEAQAAELRPHGVAAVAVTPGFLRSEEMLDYFGVTEANWRDGAQKEPHFLQSETPFFLARGLAALAAEPDLLSKSGKAYTSWGLSDDYGIEDVDGRRPHWGNYAAEQGL
ncbi:short-chain dehydrogenase [Cohnella sp. CIP 111063]|uniref:SDR family oxidoreductase n=1 Tax=unclassified Cohnella TaxID=2636738 RepID=UPI000B8C2C7D|nr:MULTISPECIES: SDR family oxidoreductase [unclassified Cohnella]OXS57728.1 short-chain dehydrogenase [Cohnella sp. CIP 111063]PRX71123.1 NAD(P)-dependent dehydrogenase (short-subunit alcohol dehydrogenase family) [Cohnella sp. SGD-V74]